MAKGRGKRSKTDSPEGTKYFAKGIPSEIEKINNNKILKSRRDDI